MLTSELACWLAGAKQICMCDNISLTHTHTKRSITLWATCCEKFKIIRFWLYTFHVSSKTMLGWNQISHYNKAKALTQTKLRSKCGLGDNSKPVTYDRVSVLFTSDIWPDCNNASNIKLLPNLSHFRLQWHISIINWKLISPQFLQLSTFVTESSTNKCHSWRYVLQSFTIKCVTN